MSAHWGRWITLVIVSLAGSAAEAVAATNPGASGKASDDVFAKCSVVVQGVKVITPEKFQALADNLADAQFAKFDKSCKGKKGNPEAVALSLKAQKQAAERFVNDLKTVASTREHSSGAVPGIPPDVARKDFGQEKAPTLPVLFRDAYSTYSLLSAPPPRERATGTQISYTRDILNSNDIISGKGAMIGWDVLSVSADSDNPLSNFGVTRMLLAPGVEFDQSRNHANPKMNTDYLAFKFIGEIEKESPGGLFPLQYFRYSGYWKTDSNSATKIAGAYVEWEPYNLDWAIGVAKLLFGGPIQFRWSPMLHFETEKVIDAGPLTNIKTGDFYSRGGPILATDVFFADGPLRNLVLGAQYRYFWSTTGNNDVKYVQANAAYNLDDAGIVALSTTYRDGILPGNATRARDIKTGLTIKY
jgi:hypothetical protein